MVFYNIELGHKKIKGFWVKRKTRSFYVFFFFFFLEYYIYICSNINVMYSKKEKNIYVMVISQEQHMQEIGKDRIHFVII